MIWYGIFSNKAWILVTTKTIHFDWTIGCFSCDNDESDDDDSDDGDSYDEDSGDDDDGDDVGGEDDGDFDVRGHLTQ